MLERAISATPESGSPDKELDEWDPAGLCWEGTDDALLPLYRLDEDWELDKAGVWRMACNGGGRTRAGAQLTLATAVEQAGLTSTGSSSCKQRTT